MACFTAKEMQLECKHRVSGRLLNLNRIDDLLRASYAIMSTFNKRGALDVFGDAARGDIEINAADIQALEDFDKDFTMIQLIQVDINKLPEAINTPQMKVRDMQSEVKAVEKLFDQKYDQSMSGAKAEQEKQLREQKKLQDERRQLQQIMQSQASSQGAAQNPGAAASGGLGSNSGGAPGAAVAPASTHAAPAGGARAPKQQVSFTLHADDGGSAANADSVDRQLQELERQFQPREAREFQPHSVLADDAGLAAGGAVEAAHGGGGAPRGGQREAPRGDAPAAGAQSAQPARDGRADYQPAYQTQDVQPGNPARQNLKPKNDLFKTRDDLMQSKNKMGSSAAETLLKRLNEIRRPEGYVQQRSGLEQSGTSAQKTDDSLAATSLKSSAGILRNKSEDNQEKVKQIHDIMESTIILQKVQAPEQNQQKNHVQTVRQQKKLEAQIKEQLENQEKEYIEAEKQKEKDSSEGSHDVQSIFKRKVEQSSHTLTSSSNPRTPSIMKDSVQPNKEQIALSEVDDWKAHDRIQQPAKKPFVKTQSQSQIKRPTTTNNEEIRKRQIQLNQRIKRIQEQQAIQSGKTKPQDIKTTSTVDTHVEDDNIVIESTELTNTLSKSQKVLSSQKPSQTKIDKSNQGDIQKKDLVVSKSSKIDEKSVQQSQQQEQDDNEYESENEDLTNTMVATGISKAQTTKQDILQTITQRMTDHDDVAQINNHSTGSSDDQVTELIQVAKQVTQPERPVEDLISEYKEVENAQRKLLKINGLQSSGASGLTKDSSASSIDSNAGVVKYEDKTNPSQGINTFKTTFNQQNNEIQTHNYNQYNLSQKTFSGNESKTQMLQQSNGPLSAILPAGVPISNPHVTSQTNFGQFSMNNPAQLQRNINQLQEESDRYQQSMQQRLNNIENQLFDNQRRIAQNPTLMSLNQTAISEAFQTGAPLGVDSITSMQRTQQMFDQQRHEIQNQIQAPIININAPQVTLPQASKSGIVPQSVSVSNVVHGSDSNNEDFDPLISRRIASQVMQKSLTPGTVTGGVSKLPWNTFEKSSSGVSQIDPKLLEKPHIVPTSSFFTGKPETIKPAVIPDASMTGTAMSNTTDYKVFLDDLQSQVNNIQTKLQQISSMAESSGEAEAEMAKIRADVAARNAASLVESDGGSGTMSRYNQRGRFGTPRLDASMSSSGVNSSGVSQSLIDRVQRNNAALLAQMSSRVSDIDSPAVSAEGIEIDVDTDDD